MVKFEDISLTLDGRSIIQNLSFEITRGQKVCFAGESGKGKTSVLKLLQGYFLPDAGYIEINGLSLSEINIDQIRRQFIWIPQNINLPVNNGLELMKLLNLSNELQKVKSYLNKLGLSGEMVEKDFKEISGGQKQRIVIAVCLSIEREMVIMDEPTSSLDYQSIEKLINTINSETNRTIISASHNQAWMNNSDVKISL